MAIDNYLIAIRLSEDKYEIIGQTLTSINDTTLKNSGRFHDVTTTWPYVDEAAIFQTGDFVTCITPLSERDKKEVLKWLRSLPAKPHFIMVHRTEWESGME